MVEVGARGHQQTKGAGGLRLRCRRDNRWCDRQATPRGAGRTPSSVRTSGGENHHRPRKNCRHWRRARSCSGVLGPRRGGKRLRNLFFTRATKAVGGGARPSLASGVDAWSYRRRLSGHDASLPLRRQRGRPTNPLELAPLVHRLVLSQRPTYHVRPGRPSPRRALSRKTVASRVKLEASGGCGA